MTKLWSSGKCAQDDVSRRCSVLVLWTVWHGIQTPSWCFWLLPCKWQVKNCCLLAEKKYIGSSSSSIFLHLLMERDLGTKMNFRCDEKRFLIFNVYLRCINIKKPAPMRVQHWNDYSISYRVYKCVCFLLVRLEEALLDWRNSRRRY